MMEKEKFQQLLLKSVNRETSSSKENWSEENPLLGHCAVVALLVQDLYGGNILRASLEGTEFEFMRSHYWNQMPDGSEIDFTADQFKGRRPELIGEIRDRQYLLSNTETKNRYEKLLGKVLEQK